MKTRIVELDPTGFVPQYWVKHFLFGGHWVALYWRNGSLYGVTDPSSMLDKATTSKEEAEELIKKWSTRQINKKRLLE